MSRELSIVAKATRLTLNGKVHQVHDRVFCVEGDHGAYLVAVADRGRVESLTDGRVSLSGVCSCPARGGCSHLLAARHAVSESAAGFFEALEDPADELEARRFGDPFRGAA